MKTNFTMKALSLAVVGLAGLGFGATAFAACPAVNTGVTPHTLTPWSGVSDASGNVTVGGPAANGSIPVGGSSTTSCRLDVKLTANAGSAAAFVRDDTPAGEGSYRARFYVNLDNLTGLTSAMPVRLFAALTDTPASSIPEVVKLTVFGNAAGTAKILGIVTPNGATTTASTVSLGTGTGWRRVELAYTKGTTGSLKIWIDANVDPNAPNANLATNNNAWGGVDSAALGLTAASATFRSAQLNKAVGFDEFDSRRTSFIGN